MGGLFLFLLCTFRPGNHLLVKGGDVHAETPPDTRKHVCPSGQPGRQTVDRVVLNAVHHLADVSLGIPPVQAAILPAVIFGTHLKISLQAPEVPVNIIRWSNVVAHPPHQIIDYL